MSLLIFLAVLLIVLGAIGSTAGKKKKTVTVARQRPARSPTPEDHFELNGKGGFDVAIVGESHYQTELREIANMPIFDEDGTCFAELFCEDDNTYDNNAVLITIEGRKVGYLNRDMAPFYRKIIADAGFGEATGKCKARLFGGTRQKPSIGVWIDI